MVITCTRMELGGGKNENKEPSGSLGLAGMFSGSEFYPGTGPRNRHPKQARSSNYIAFCLFFFKKLSFFFKKCVLFVRAVIPP